MVFFFKIKIQIVEHTRDCLKWKRSLEAGWHDDLQSVGIFFTVTMLRLLFFFKNLSTQKVPLKTKVIDFNYFSCSPLTSMILILKPLTHKGTVPFIYLFCLNKKIS